MGWEAFEPTLIRAEEMDADTKWRCAAEIPEEWYEGDRGGLHQLVEAIYDRRPLIRGFISNFRESTRNPFPNWGTRRRARPDDRTASAPTLAPARPRTLGR
jgi:hypothetical protein